MYALSCRPTSLSLSWDGSHLALCGTTTHTGRDEEEQAEEVMVLALPDKLLLSGDPRQEGLRANRRDFALRAGAREEKGAAPLLQVQFCGVEAEDDLLTLNRDAVTRWTVSKGSGMCAVQSFYQGQKYRAW